MVMDSNSDAMDCIADMLFSLQ